MRPTQGLASERERGGQEHASAEGKCVHLPSSANGARGLLRSTATKKARDRGIEMEVQIKVEMEVEMKVEHYTALGEASSRHASEVA